GAHRVGRPGRDPRDLRPRGGDGGRAPFSAARGRRHRRDGDRALDGRRLFCCYLTPLMLPLRMVRRAEPSRAMQWVAPLLAVALTLLFGLALFAALGFAPLRAMRALFLDPLSDLNGWSELLLKASPLCLIALGLAIGFRSNVWNIGAEGQMYLGGICATGLAIHFQASWGSALLPAMVIAGAVGGMLWASIVAYLRVRFA